MPSSSKAEDTAGATWRRPAAGPGNEEDLEGPENRLTPESLPFFEGLSRKLAAAAALDLEGPPKLGVYADEDEEEGAAALVLTFDSQGNALAVEVEEAAATPVPVVFAGLEAEEGSLRKSIADEAVVDVGAVGFLEGALEVGKKEEVSFRK